MSELSLEKNEWWVEAGKGPGHTVSNVGKTQLCGKPQ